MSVLMYGCTTWILMNHLKKNIDGNYTRMLHVVLNKSMKQYLAKQQLYDHSSLIPSKKGKQDMLDIAGEVRINS